MSTPVSKSQGQIGSLLTSAFFVVAGVVTLYDTTGYTDRDSQVFPMTVAILLIITAGISFITRFLKPSDEGGFGTGIWWRRVLLIVTMLLACFAMPHVGFLPAGAIAFAGGLIAAMHDDWSKSTILLYWGAGAVIMLAFFALFKFVLLVPLP
ncbi:MAG: tripartite tricarboxylate transporter TctB family protein [Tateyamaria sp.]|uniref:tripartite tricarboxylate transporter TctB family protein n=1 Tax=Tateyamaria sp. TaxID=1929288 RepID=UPI00329D64B5